MRKCFFLYDTLGLPARGGHSLDKYCIMVYGSILMLYQPFFGSDFPLRRARKFLFYSLDGATIFAKWWSKIAKSPKIDGKVFCAPLRIDS